jgi:hypothetical protein
MTSLGEPRSAPAPSYQVTIPLRQWTEAQRPHGSQPVHRRRSPYSWPRTRTSPRRPSPTATPLATVSKPPPTAATGTWSPQQRPPHRPARTNSSLRAQEHCSCAYSSPAEPPPSRTSTNWQSAPADVSVLCVAASARGSSLFCVGKELDRRETWTDNLARAGRFAGWPDVPLPHAAATPNSPERTRERRRFAGDSRWSAPAGTALGKG